MKTNNLNLLPFLKGKNFQEKMDVLVENHYSSVEDVDVLRKTEMFTNLIGQFILESPYIRQTEFLTDGEGSDELVLKIAHYLKGNQSEKKSLGIDLLDFITQLAFSYHEEDIEEGLEDAYGRAVWLENTRIIPPQPIIPISGYRET